MPPTTFERTRQQGTQQTITNDPAKRIEVIRRIVEQKQYEHIDGQMLDLFSASAIIKVYDAINPTNQQRYAKLPAWQMARIAFQLIK